jgi:hypothetical protein
MNAQDFRSLQEAYMDVVMNEAKKSFPFEKVDNKSKSKEKQKLQLKKDVEDGLISHKRATPLSSKLINQKVKMDMVWAKEREKKKEDDNLKRSPTFYRKDKHLSKMTKTQREQVDLYDIILSHLLDEGYAETPEAAEAIMVNMSEDWRESIVEEVLDEKTASPAPRYNIRRGLDAKSRRLRRSSDFYTYGGENQDPDERTISTSKGEGGITKNPKKLRKQQIMGEH